MFYWPYWQENRDMSSSDSGHHQTQKHPHTAEPQTLQARCPRTQQQFKLGRAVIEPPTFWFLDDPLYFMINCRPTASGRHLKQWQAANGSQCPNSEIQTLSNETQNGAGFTFSILPFYRVMSNFTFPRNKGHILMRYIVI